MPKSGPRPHSRGPRPHIWKVGPDPVQHKKYRVWLQQRNQALWRGEGWDLDFETWCGIWGEYWHSRGRERGSWCMTRLDWSLPWSKDNVAIVTREQHAKAQGLARAAGYRSQSQQARRARMGI